MSVNIKALPTSIKTSMITQNCKTRSVHSKSSMAFVFWQNCSRNAHHQPIYALSDWSDIWVSPKISAEWKNCGVVVVSFFPSFLWCRTGWTHTPLVVAIYEVDSMSCILGSPLHYTRGKRILTHTHRVRATIAKVKASSVRSSTVFTITNAAAPILFASLPARRRSPLPPKRNKEPISKNQPRKELSSFFL